MSSSCLLSLQETLQDQQVGLSDPGSFQITASILGPRVYEILCAPFMSVVSLSASPLGLPKASPAGLQNQTFWGSSSWHRTPQLRSPMWGSDQSLLGENLCNCNYSPICVLPSWGLWVLTIPQLCPSYPSHCVFFFISLVVEDLFW